MLARLLELFIPHLLGKAKDRCGELAREVVLLGWWLLLFTLLRDRRLLIADELVQQIWIDAQQRADDENQNGAAADSSAFRTEAPSVFKVAAFFAALPFHDETSNVIDSGTL